MYRRLRPSSSAAAENGNSSPASPDNEDEEAQRSSSDSDDNKETAVSASLGQRQRHFFLSSFLRRTKRPRPRPLLQIGLVPKNNRYYSASFAVLLLVTLVILLGGTIIGVRLPYWFWGSSLKKPSSSGPSATSAAAAAAAQHPIITLPKDVKNVSVVIMNHSRPRMIKESALLPTLISHPAVDEILLCHSNPKTKFEYKDKLNKVQNIDAVQANQQMGLSLRFHFCRQAKNEWVMHVDDDMEFSANAVTRLVAEFAKNPHRIVGKYGRGYNYWLNLNRNGYDTKTLQGPAEVVLTKILIMPRNICSAFFQYAPLVNDLLPESKPLWNGEDIFVNLVANHVYHVPQPNGPYNNYAINDLDVWEASDKYKDDDTGEHDVSGNMDRHRPWNVGWSNWWKAFWRSQAHAAYRGKLWYTAKKRLAELP